MSDANPWPRDRILAFKMVEVVAAAELQGLDVIEFRFDDDRPTVRMRRRTDGVWDIKQAP
jgi:hypothetical protein